MKQRFGWRRGCPGAVPWQSCDPPGWQGNPVWLPALGRGSRAGLVTGIRPAGVVAAINGPAGRADPVAIEVRRGDMQLIIVVG
jgi:hypothetical protein